MSCLSIASSKLSKTTAKVIVASFAILIVVSGCGSSGSLPEIEGKVTIGAYTGEVGTLLWVAKEQGFFEQVGLNVELIPFSAGKLASDALAEGKLDIISCADFVFVKKSFFENDLRVMGSIATSQICWLLGRKDHGVSSPGDLKGKKIGITLGSSGEYYLGRFLAANGLNFDEVTVVNLPPPVIVKSMNNGDIDAALTWQPNIHNIQKNLEDKVVSFNAQGGQAFYFVLVSKAGWIARHPQHAERFMLALMEAEKWVNTHQDDVKALLTRLFDFDPGYLSKVWEDQQIELSFPQAMVVAMDGEKRWLVKNRLVNGAKAPDYTHFIYVDAMEKVKKQAITVIK